MSIGVRPEGDRGRSPPAAGAAGVRGAALAAALVAAALPAGCATGEVGDPDPPLGAAESALTAAGTAPRAATAAALDSMLGTSGRKPATEHGGDVFVRWHYSDAPLLLWGEGLRLRFADYGCATRNVVDTIRCFLAANAAVWGIDATTGGLPVVSVVELKDGRRVYRFRQHVSGFPVPGADVLVTVSSDLAAVTRVYSNNVRGLRTTVPSSTLAGASFPATMPAPIDAALRTEAGGAYSRRSEPRLVLLVDQGARSLDAVPAWRFEIAPAAAGTTVTGEERIVDVDFGATRVLSSRRTTADSPLGVKIYTQAAFTNYTDTSCADPGGYPWNCLLSGNTYCLADPVDPSNGHCTQFCGLFGGGDCTPFGPLWSCSSSIIVSGMCVMDCLGCAGHVIHDDPAGWLGNYDNYIAFYRFHEALDQWNEFMWTSLGRNGWDDEGGKMAGALTASCMSGQCGAKANGGNGLTSYHQWGEFLSDAESVVVSRDWTIGHEGGHSVALDEAAEEPGGNLNAECVSENVADVVGSLYARPLHPTADSAYSGHQSTGYFEYPLRSHYDFAPCPGEGHSTTTTPCTVSEQCPPYFVCEDGKCGRHPDEHNNGTVWGRRFVKLLVDGSASAGEDFYGLAWPGLGLATTTDIVYEALIHLASTTSQLVWADLIASAAEPQGADALTAVRYALGAIGFPGATFSMGVSTNTTPRGVWWADWPLSTSNIRVFYVYRDVASGRIKARYHQGAAWKDQFVSTGTTTEPPTVVAYDKRLHVFWRDTATNNIMLRRLSTAGAWDAADKNLGSTMDLKAAGPFDAAVFQAKLYVGFVRAGTTKLHIARCTSTDLNGCSGDQVAEWTEYAQPDGSKKRYKNMGRDTTSGVALEAASGVQGAGAGEYLYVLTALPTTNVLRIVRINTLDNVPTDGERTMPDVYPSYKADANGVRGLVARPSAIAGEGLRLYLAWNADGTDRIFASILREWGPTAADAWFTRSVPMVDEVTSGVSFWKHDSYYSARYVHASPGGGGYYAVVWTRY
jgi:hypothetical protein